MAPSIETSPNKTSDKKPGQHPKHSTDYMQRGAVELLRTTEMNFKIRTSLLVIDRCFDAPTILVRHTMSRADLSALLFRGTPEAAPHILVVPIVVPSS
jgi:hypothetical protein